MKLKKIFLYSATMLLLVSCANEDKQGSSGYGAINVQVSADYKVVPVTRSTAESASTIENPDVNEFALKLVSSDGSFSRAWDSLADFDPATKIPVGTYTMSAFYGDIDIEGFEKPFYLGETPVAVRDRENSSVKSMNPILFPTSENPLIFSPNRRSISAWSSLIFMRSISCGHPLLSRLREEVVRVHPANPPLAVRDIFTFLSAG